MTFRKILSLVIIMALLPLSAFSQKNKKGTVKDTREYVDLGLPSKTLWATCNIGASKPEEFGLYFAWGETKGYTSDTSDGHQFNMKTYKLCRGTYDTLTKYCGVRGFGIVDNKKELDPEDDAATVNWGNKWQMPSSDQMMELCDSANTKIEWTTLNGVNGRKITSRKNGNSIFLPAAGWRYDDRLWDDTTYGQYLSRTLFEPSTSYSLLFKDESIYCFQSQRVAGASVRPVRTQKQKSGKKKINQKETEEDVFMMVPVEVPLPK